MASISGSLLRQRIRSAASPSASVKLGNGSDHDYFSDDTNGHTGNGKQPYVENGHDGVSSASQYESGSDSGDDTTPGASVIGDATHMDGSAVSTPLSHPAKDSDTNGGIAPDSGTPSRSWNEFDLSVVVALVSPIGNWLTGGDHVKNLFLILLLIFYLHQIIEIPWSLYHQARPRRRPQPLPKDASTEDRFHNIATSELHQLESFFLATTVASPLLGAILLRVVITSVSGPSSISWFSTSLFVLATGIRPWKHAVERLRKRTSDLHDVIHYPASPSQDIQAQLEALVERVAQLENEAKAAKEVANDTRDELYDHVDEAVEGVEKMIRKQEKKWDVARIGQEQQLAKIEQNVETLLEKKEIDGAAISFSKTSAHASTLFSAVVEQLSPILPFWMVPDPHKEKSHPPRSPKTSRSRKGSHLETIPEGSVFNTKQSKRRQSRFHVPGLNLVLRIGDLAALPVRTIVQYLLSGRIYTPRRPLSSSSQ
ncbi:hypothetical protein SERLA73DRAFT_172723 [Serpula lacrymans var. lacrymans S7.3]|uniref:Uncharacterized protein n=1 Tax=Serpula lacrymans var. lacrymans (strain S7.3) TaxID=936435 RepID=F8QGD2_SERL3|nr:hypothetical protein SERLA73DRAFT_172723 [Serpula lacrymans var. lacrymans S7.3]